MKFYHKMILQKGFKKCSCSQCAWMTHPMLIRFNSDSQQYYNAHMIMNKQNVAMLSSRDQTAPLTVSVLL